MFGCQSTYTYEFVRAALPEGAKRVLEVGCGDGEVASLLARAGLSVVALDADEKTVALAKSRGVDARRAEWPDFSDGSFDAVVFTRSLHHVRDCAEAFVPRSIPWSRPAGSSSRTSPSRSRTSGRSDGFAASWPCCETRKR